MNNNNTPLSPERLAKLANALGVATPVPNPRLVSTSRYLLHVLPPDNLNVLALNAPGYHKHFHRGSLLPLLSTLNAQLNAIARHYALPSTAGIILYLYDQPHGPRISHDIWKQLWSRPQLRPAHTNNPPDSPQLPILAKIEFDIDTTKALWFHPWFKRLQSPKTHNTTNQENQVLEILDSMSKKPILPPLVTNSLNEQTTPELSFLAYTQPLPDPELDSDSLPLVQREGKREFAVFDDFELDLDPTLDSDPNDRRKSQLIMSAKLDEIERTMAQLSPRILQTELFSEASSSPKGKDFLSPRKDNIQGFVTSSPPRLSLGKPEEAESWPAVPFSMMREQENRPVETGPLALPTLALNGVSTLPLRTFTSAPTRPPPAPPLDSPGTVTETEKRTRELEEERGVYNIAIRPPRIGEEVIPLSPDPFGRYPSSSPSLTSGPIPSPSNPERIPETRTRSGTIADAVLGRTRSGTTTATHISRFSVDSGEDPVALAAASKKNSDATRTNLMSVKTIKRLWRKSKEKERQGGGGGSISISHVGGDESPLITPTFGTFMSSNDFDKTLPLAPPPPQRPERPSEESLDFPDISMQAVVPPRLSPSPRMSPLINGTGEFNDGINVRGGSASERKPPHEMVTGRRTPQEGLMVPPPSRPSLDLLPEVTQTGRRTPQEMLSSGRRTPQHQSRPSLEVVQTGRRTPQDQSRPSLDQHRPLLEVTQTGRRTPQDQFVQPRPLLDQIPSAHPHHIPQQHQQPQQQRAVQLPMFQGRNPQNASVKPVLAMHYPSRSLSSTSPLQTQQQSDRWDVNQLMFDQESPYPIRLGSVTTSTTTNATTKIPSSAGSYSGGNNVSTTVAVTTPPLAQGPTRPPPAEDAEKTPLTTTTTATTTTATTAIGSTMRKSILKWKLANANSNGTSNKHGISESLSSVSSVSTTSSGPVPRRSLERSERPGGGTGAGGGPSGHVRAGGGGKRPGVINFGSISLSSASSSSSSSSYRGGIPPIPEQYSSSGSSSATSSDTSPTSSSLSSIGDSKLSTVNEQFKLASPSQLQVKVPLTSTSTSSKTPAPLSSSSSSSSAPVPRPQSIHSVDAPTIERRPSNASSFDMAQFEFVSPVILTPLAAR